MSRFLSRLKRSEGFTLVELMVVVAIIGLLSAVAIPNFKKYQAKSKTSEAKLQLSSVYTALQSFYSDYDSYANCLNLMGYDPSVEISQRYYVVGFGVGNNTTSAGNAVANGASTSCTGTGVAHDLQSVPASNANISVYGAGKTVAGTAALLGASITATTIATVAQPASLAFTAGALGIIDASKNTAATADAWTINENKRIIQVRTGF
jgi:type IV pilus assembly protein PilA